MLGRRDIPSSYRNELIFHRKQTLYFHFNGMRFSACSRSGERLAERAWYSAGSGLSISVVEVSVNIIEC